MTRMHVLHRTQHAGHRAGGVSLAIVISLVLLAALVYLMSSMDQRQHHDDGERLFMYCAAGMRPAVERVVADYAEEVGVTVELQYGGSNTLLSQLEVSQQGDLYLAADDSYTTMARDKGLLHESIPLARIRPVIVQRKDAENQITSIDDLLDPALRIALGNPDQAAVGRKSKRLLRASGHWQRLDQQIRNKGVYKPTVNEVANDVALGSVDAGIVWDCTAAQYDDLRAIHVPELEAGTATINVGVLDSADHPTAALRFARYLAAKDRGLGHFHELGYDALPGDPWAQSPELTVYCGAVNRRAMEPVLNAFSEREGVTINTVYNGCGILTAQMRAMRQGDSAASSTFPDLYLACDRYYLETVDEWFDHQRDISETDIVIVVGKGNPKGIEKLADLTDDKVRVVLGEPDQCTIGVLSRRLLQSQGLYHDVLDNVVTHGSSSALLIPNVTTGAADAVLAYRTDAESASDRTELITIDSPLAIAVQPVGVAVSTPYRQLALRLHDHIRRAREDFEAAGFRWHEESDGDRP